MNKNLYILILLISILGCQKPYNPKLITQANNYLVVEGVISTGQDSIIIRLSRTVPVSSSAGSTPESGANVIVASDAGTSYPLVETGNGYYRAAGLNTNTTNNYSLKITTANGKVYQSDFVPAKNSPPIDSVYYGIQSNGLEIYSNTHDPSNNTRYYRWDYTETWEFTSAFDSFDYLSTSPIDTVLVRSPANQVYVCWRSDTSSSITLNSSAKLTKDIITANPLTFIASTSEKLGNRYSIMVRQYALTPDAYNYYQQLKKNSEQLGSIFDAQPSELPGNIHCVTNPAETVVGYITAGSPAEKRIFINNQSLPAWLADNPYAGCIADTVLFQEVIGKSIVNEVPQYIYSGIQMPIIAITPPGSSKILGYSASSPACVDCTLRGTNIQPGFWTNE
jgi:hypothetical protein